MDDWFRWFMGLLITGWTSVISGLAAILFGKLKVITDRQDSQSLGLQTLDKRLSLLEARPAVDPLEYVKALTELTASLNSLASKVERLTKEVDLVCDRVEQLTLETINAKSKPFSR